MKTINIAVLGALAAVSLTGCEMKDELWGGTSQSDTGALELGVSVKQPLSQSRATEISTDNFPVTITDAEGTVIKKYDHASEVPASVTLPVGDYIVDSHSDAILTKNMTDPYYGGQQSMTITKGITTQANVICKMQNSRIQVSYGDDFIDGFNSWTIVINDGSSQVITYTSSNTEEVANKVTTPVYWWFDTDVESITVNITAETSKGNTVSESRTFRKADASEKYDDVSDFFEGGDAIVVTMGATAASSGNVTGVTINTSVTFENHEDSVEIPVMVSTPITIEEPDGNNYFTTGVEMSDTSYPKNVEFDVTTTRGIQNAYLTINSNDNESLKSYAATLGLGVDSPVDLTSSSASSLSSLIALPTAGDKTYTLKLGDSFMQMLQSYAGTHFVRLSIVDVNGNNYTRSIKFIVTVSEKTDTDAPSVEFEGGESEVSFDVNNLPSSFDATISASKGIDKIMVTIDAGNSGFEAALDDLTMDDQNFRDGVNIVDNSDFENLLVTFKAGHAPTQGETEYKFPIGAFLSLLKMYGETDDGSAHVFHITVHDAAGAQTTASLTVHFYE